MEAQVPVHPELHVPDWLQVPLPSHWPTQADLLGYCQHMGPGMAALLILLGVIYLLFGFKLYQILIMLNASAVGAAVGFIVGAHFGIALPLTILFGFIAAAMTWPLMRWAVAIMGCAYGALLGASVWHVFGLDAHYGWSGALTGCVAFGLLCFILFRGCLTMYSSLQGAVMLCFGMLGMIYKYDQFSPKLTDTLLSRTFLLPMIIFIATVMGMIYQLNFNGSPAPSGKK